MTTPALPEGFVLEEKETETIPALPEGFQLEKKKKQPIRERVEESLTGIGQQAGRKFLAAALSSPRVLAELVSKGSEFLAEKGAEGKGQIDPFTQNVLKVMGFPETVLNRIGYPDQDQFESLIMSLGEKTGAAQKSKEPESIGERFAAKAGEFAGLSLLGRPTTLAERLLLGSLGGVGAAGAEEAGAGAGGQIGAAIGLPAAIQLAYAIKTGKFKPNSQELEDLAKFFRQQGFTEEEIVPLLQPKAKQKALKAIAKSDEKVQSIVGKKGSVEQKLGAGYEKLKEASRELPPASQKQVTNLINQFEDISSSLKQSALPSDEKVAAIRKIDDAIENLWQNGITPEGIIETSIDINDMVNWNSYKQGKKDLAKLKKPLKELYREISPEGAATFDKLNEGWSRLKTIQKNIGPNNMKSLVNYGKGLVYIGNAVRDIATGDIAGLAATGATALGVELSQQIAKKMLVDPKYQNILLKSATAIKKGSRPQILKAYDEFVSQVLTDFPDESKKVNWEDLKNKSSQ